MIPCNQKKGRQGIEFLYLSTFPVDFISNQTNARRVQEQSSRTCNDMHLNPVDVAAENIAHHAKGPAPCRPFDEVTARRGSGESSTQSLYKTNQKALPLRRPEREAGVMNGQ